MKYFFSLISASLIVLNSVYSQVENVKRKNEVQLINNDSICYLNGDLYTGEVVDFSGQRFDKTKLLYDAHFKDGQRNGPFKKWYPNFKIETIENYKLGLKDGVQAYFFNSGNKKAEFKYINGVPDGIWTEWHDNKQIKTTCTYVMGSMLDGTYTNFLPDGQKESAVTYKNGKITTSGRYEGDKFIVVQELSSEKYPNGQLKSEGTIVSGKNEGNWTTWYENGGKKSEKSYESGKLNGHFIMYYNNATKEVEGNYKMDEKDGTWKSWYENGALKSEENYYNGRKVGMWTIYYDNGQINSIGNYSNDLQTGNWKSYFRNGKIKEHGTYISGKKEGPWISYYENGQKEFDGNYLNDLQSGYGMMYYNSYGTCWYKGSWKEGGRWGQGEYFDQESDNSYRTYVGEFERDKFNGQGTLKVYGSNRSILLESSGEWKEGHLFNGKELIYYYYVNAPTKVVTKNYVNGKESFWKGFMDDMQNQMQKRY